MSVYPPGEAYVFSALKVNQSNLKVWFEEFEDLEGDELVKSVYLAEYLGEDIAEIKDKIVDVALFEGAAIEYVESYLEESGLLAEVPASLKYYIDTEALARDMLINGDISEICIDDTDYIVRGL